jgi:hypothetical protein
LSIVYFTDRDLGLKFPEVLKQAGLTVERHRDHFKDDAADEEWLAEVGRRNWVAITHNSRIRYHPETACTSWSMRSDPRSRITIVLRGARDAEFTAPAFYLRRSAMKRFIRFVIVLVVAAFPITSFSQDQVSGSFVVKGKTTPFKYVYAYWNTQFMDPAVQDVYVLLSDVPVTKDQLPPNDERVSKMAALVRADKIHALELHFAVPGKTLDAGAQAAIFHKGVSEGRHGANGMMHFQAATTDGKTIDGKMWTDEEVAGRDWTAQASFKVKVPPKK